MLRMFLFLALIVGCQGYRRYQDRIPNGDNVPHPCKDNFMWRAVGHMTPGDGVDMDQFGIDFSDMSAQWSDELCRKDSDGDGKTNGEELGDPDCVWHPGIFPSRTSNISHPGICDPWGSEKCEQKNSWVACDEDIFECEATSDPDVKNFTLLIPPTKVPAEKISKYCMPVQLKDYLDISQDYHLVASQPMIDNTKVMHHIKLFGCPPTVKLTPTAEPCSNAHMFCEEMLAVWTLGLPGTCEYRDAGFLIGKNSYKKMVMQFDWANPELRTDYVDSSGLTLYYTSKLRRHNLGRLKLSQIHLDIPPGSKRSVVESSCPADCTNRAFKDTIYLTSGMNHMQYLGYSVTVDQIRESTTVEKLINDTNFSYDSPEVHAYTTPVEFRPGDELKTTCVYRSVSKNRTTTLDEETCDSFFSYFPKENLRIQVPCLQWKSLDLCKMRLGEPLNGCSYLPYANPSSDQVRPIIDEVLDSCNDQGQCRPECKAVVDRIKKNPCFQGDMAEFLLNMYKENNDIRLTKFTQMFAPCEVFPSSSASLPFTSLFLMLLLLFLSE